MENSENSDQSSNINLPPLAHRSGSFETLRRRAISAFAETYFTFTMDLAVEHVGTSKKAFQSAYELVIRTALPNDLAAESLLYGHGKEKSRNPNVGKGKGASTAVSELAKKQSFKVGHHNYVYPNLVLRRTVSRDKLAALQQIITGDRQDVIIPDQLINHVSDLTERVYTPSERATPAQYIPPKHSMVSTPSAARVKSEHATKPEPEDDLIDGLTTCPTNITHPHSDAPVPISMVMLSEIHTRVMSWGKDFHSSSSEQTPKLLDLNRLQMSSSYFCCRLCSMMDFIQDGSYDDTEADSIKCSRCMYSCHQSCAFSAATPKRVITEAIQNGWTCPICTAETEKCWRCTKRLDHNKRLSSWPCTFCHHWLCGSCAKVITITPEIPLLDKYNPDGASTPKISVCNVCFSKLDRLGGIKITLDECSI